MVRQIKIDAPDYPSLLKNIYDPPKELFVLGDVDLLKSEKIIAIVGTRQMTDYGKKVSAKLTKELVESGYVIISGMALGIDAVAHWTAIDNGGKTIAVLGAGVDIIYPPRNKDLYFKIIESGGAIVSEVPPGETVPRALFAARNRIVSGLAQAVIVIEGSLRSGSLITARLALDQGKDVFAVPGSPGTDYLIEQGAGILSA